MKKTIFILIIVTLILLFNTIAAFAVEIDTEEAQKKVDEAATLIVVTVGYAIAIFYTIKDVIAIIPNKNLKDIAMVIVKYIVIYAVLEKLTVLFKLGSGFIGGIFS